MTTISVSKDWYLSKVDSKINVKSPPSRIIILERLDALISAFGRN